MYKYLMCFPSTTTIGIGYEELSDPLVFNVKYIYRCVCSLVFDLFISLFKFYTYKY